MPPVCSSSSSSRGLSERRLDTGGSGKREEWRSRLNELRVEKSQESFQLPQEVHVPPGGLRRFMFLLKAFKQNKHGPTEEGKATIQL